MGEDSIRKITEAELPKEQVYQNKKLIDYGTDLVLHVGYSGIDG